MSPSKGALPYAELVRLELVERRLRRIAEQAEAHAHAIGGLIEREAGVVGDPVKVSDLRDVLCQAFWDQFALDADRAERLTEGGSG